MDYAQRASQLSDAIIAHRHYLHQHAELSLKETETTAYLTSQLQALGIRSEERRVGKECRL